MTVRMTFLVLVVPLFLLLAGVNSALLFFWERAEAANGLETQAIAAAVTTAAFASGPDDLAATLADPGRDAALRSAAANIRGLEGLYIVSPGRPAVRIAGREDSPPPGRFEPPARPFALPIRADAAGRHLTTALAPAAGGRFVVAQIDAEPLFAQVAGLERLIAVLIAVAGFLGFSLAWAVAGRIGRELARNSAMVAAIRADAATPDMDDLRLRETRDLANAVRLMKTGVAGRLARGGRELAMRDRQRDEAGSVADVHGAAFPPLATAAAGMRLAVRLLGQPPAGTFYALATGGGRAGLVLGECAGETPAEALARALSARRFVERRLFDGEPAVRIEQARAAFDLTRVAWLDLGEVGAAGAVLALLDGDKAERAAAYLQRSGGLDPQAVVDDLAVLLAATGVAAVVKPGSGEGGQG
jgi:hypothetical protein